MAARPLGLPVSESSILATIDNINHATTLWKRVGRSKCISTLLSRALTGTHPGVIIVGPSGSGKSDLLNALKRLQPNIYIRGGYADSFTSSLPQRGREDGRGHFEGALEALAADMSSPQKWLLIDDVDLVEGKMLGSIARFLANSSARVVVTVRSIGLGAILDDHGWLRQRAAYFVPPMTVDEIGTMCELRLGGALDCLTLHRLADMSDGWPRCVQAIVDDNVETERITEVRGLWIGSRLVLPAWLESVNSPLLSAQPSERQLLVEKIAAAGPLEMAAAHEMVGPDDLAFLKAVGLLESVSIPGKPGLHLQLAEPFAHVTRPLRSLNGTEDAGLFESSLGYSFLQPRSANGNLPHEVAALAQASRAGTLPSALDLEWRVDECAALESDWHRRMIAGQARLAAGNVRQAISDLSHDNITEHDDHYAANTIALIQALLEGSVVAAAKELASDLRRLGLERRSVRETVWGTCLFGRAALAAGDIGQAETSLGEGLAMAESGLKQDPVIPITLASLAVCAGWRGDDATARRFLSEAYANTSTEPSVLLLDQVQLLEAEMELVLGQHSPAATLAQDLGTRAGLLGRHAVALRAFALAARAMPSGELAERVSAEAELCHHDMAAHMVTISWALAKPQGTALADAAHASSDAGLALLAAELWSRAALKSHTIGKSDAVTLARQSLARVQAAGIPWPAHWPLAMPSTLTSRELEVARMISRGDTVTSVSQTLHLSRRTVENHLLRSYRKLGINSKEGLAGALAEHLGAQTLRPNHLMISAGSDTGIPEQRQQDRLGLRTGTSA